MKKISLFLMVVVIFVVVIGLFAGCAVEEEHTHGQKEQHSSHDGCNHAH